MNMKNSEERYATVLLILIKNKNQKNRWDLKFSPALHFFDRLYDAKILLAMAGIKIEYK
jgi:hypothetical protein